MTLGLFIGMVSDPRKEPFCVFILQLLEIFGSKFLALNPSLKTWAANDGFFIVGSSRFGHIRARQESNLL